MSVDLLRLDLQRRHRGIGTARSLLKCSGVDSQQVLDILQGRLRPEINVFDMHVQWALAAHGYHQDQERKKAIAALCSEFHQLKSSMDRIMRSRLFYQSTKDVLKTDYDTIASALRVLNSDISDNDVTKPSSFSVRLYAPRDRRKGNEWSRQAFWTPVILELHRIWKKVGKTDYKAFKDIARLLALTFPPFPDDLNVIKRRYYHANAATKT